MKIARLDLGDINDFRNHVRRLCTNRLHRFLIVHIHLREITDWWHQKSWLRAIWRPLKRAILCVNDTENAEPSGKYEHHPGCGTFLHPGCGSLGGLLSTPSTYAGEYRRRSQWPGFFDSAGRDLDSITHLRAAPSRSYPLRLFQEFAGLEFAQINCDLPVSRNASSHLWLRSFLPPLPLSRSRK